MNEDALRELIRESVARHMEVQDAERDIVRPVPVTFLSHPSHYRYALAGTGGPCLIEPNVTCNHCGYCESHGY